MKPGAGSGAGVRLWVWIAGAALSLGYYLAEATHPPRGTPAGVEHFLFGLGDLEVKLFPAPSGRQWVLVREVTEAYMPLSPPPPPTLWQRVQSFEWAPLAAPSRRLTPFQVPGTWEVKGGSLHRVWTLPANGWLDDHHLWSSDSEWSTSGWVLDRRSGRTTDESLEGVQDRYPPEHEVGKSTDHEDWDPEPLTALTSALEELPPDVSRSWEYRRFAAGGTEVYLVATVDPKDEPVALYAVTDEPAPRILRLTRNARPLALSRDGRTLFFQRDSALWRLDFRQPLPTLREVPLPELPDPLSTHQEP